jgi:hypothetical protein
MGSQFRFVMHPEDEQAFVAHIRSVRANDLVSWTTSGVASSDTTKVQLTPSRIIGVVITEGQLWVSTFGHAENHVVQKLYRALVRHAKRHYANSVLQWINPTIPLAPAGNNLSANPSKPDQQIWLAPHAMHWLKADPKRCVKPFPGLLIEGRLVSSKPETTYAFSPDTTLPR